SRLILGNNTDSNAVNISLNGSNNTSVGSGIANVLDISNLAGPITLQAGGIGSPYVREYLSTTGLVGVNTTSPLAIFDARTVGASTLSKTIPVASFSAQTNAFAGVVVDNSGLGDIFTASSSGLTRFGIKNNGDIIFDPIGTTNGQG